MERWEKAGGRGFPAFAESLGGGEMSKMVHGRRRGGEGMRLKMHAVVVDEQSLLPLSRDRRGKLAGGAGGCTHDVACHSY